MLMSGHHHHLPKNVTSGIPLFFILHFRVSKVCVGVQSFGRESTSIHDRTLAYEQAIGDARLEFGFRPKQSGGLGSTFG